MVTLILAPHEMDHLKQFMIWATLRNDIRIKCSHNWTAEALSNGDVGQKNSGEESKK